jgi:hypothetical protein
MKIRGSEIISYRCEFVTKPSKYQSSSTIDVVEVEIKSNGKIFRCELREDGRFSKSGIKTAIDNGINSVRGSSQTIDISIDKQRSYIHFKFGRGDVLQFTGDKL